MAFDEAKDLADWTGKLREGWQDTDTYWGYIGIYRDMEKSMEPTTS